MLLIVKKLFIFLLPLLIFLGFVDYKVNNHVDVHRFHRQILEKQLDSVEILILGSSHSANALNSKLFHYNTINIAMGGQSLYHDYWIAKTYIPKCENLKYIILPISYFSFEYEMYNSTLKPYMYDYKYVWGCDYQLDKFSVKSYFRIFTYGLFHSLKIVYRIEKEFNNLDRNSTTVHIFKSNKQQIAKKRFKGWKEGWMNAQNTQAIISHVKKLIESCQKYNIKLIFITTPLSKEMLNNLEAEVLEKNDSIMKSLINEFDVTYLNFLNNDRFTGNDFSDSDHLNVNGAKKLTFILDSLIN